MASIDQSLERLPVHERTSHLRHKIEPRKKLHIKDVTNFFRRNATKIVAAAAIAGLAVEGYNLLKGEANEPNAFANRTIEINDQTVLRSTPIVQDLSGDINNTVLWQDIDAFKTQSGDWIKYEEGKTYNDKKPAIYIKNEERPELFWYVLDAKLRDGKEERIYINGNPSQSEGVKITEPGQIYMLGGKAGADWTGTISVQK